MLSQMMSRLGDDGHVDKIIKELGKADSSTRSGLAMRRGGRQNQRLNGPKVLSTMATQ